ncbi:MAG: alpha/beta hydrolase fold protein [Acidobacteriaceae bacterium]|nr:alpha/beta hydrolase fold protein [Acidobacteriaceae bacterium]
MSVSSAPPAKMRHHSRFALVCRSVVGLILVAVVAGAAFQSVEAHFEASRYPFPGTLVDIGGERLHINCTGQGSPTVIMDAGLGDSSVTWELVQPEVSKFTRVCSYDRAGYGWSEGPTQPRTTGNIVSELERLLSAAHVSGPYILVGHSFGGFNVRVFASRHLDQVAGMVLVDSSHPDQLNRFPPSAQPESVMRHYEIGIWTMPLGVPRILGWCRDDYTFPNQPLAWTRIAPEAIALDCQPLTWHTLLAEELEFRENSRAVAATGTLGDKPLVVLSHDPEVGSGFPPAEAPSAERAWTDMQEELRHLSSRSKRIVAKSSGHYIEVYRPELVINAVRDIVFDARGVAPFQMASETVIK